MTEQMNGRVVVKLSIVSTLPLREAEDHLLFRCHIFCGEQCKDPPQWPLDASSTMSYTL